MSKGNLTLVSLSIKLSDEDIEKLKELGEGLGGGVNDAFRYLIEVYLKQEPEDEAEYLRFT